MAEILEQALDVALDKKDPKRKLERRTARQKATKAQPRPDEMSEDVAPGVPRVKDQPARSRYILSETERVHARGEHQCEYKSVDGRRCRSRTGLQVDHERPFAREQKANSRSPATALGRLFYFQDLDVLGLPNHEKQPMAVLLDLRQDLHLLSYVAILQIALEVLQIIGRDEDADVLRFIVFSFLSSSNATIYWAGLGSQTVEIWRVY